MFAIGVAALVALPDGAALVDAELSLLPQFTRCVVFAVQTQSQQGVVQPLMTLPIDHTEGDSSMRQRLPHQGVHRPTHMGAIALQAIGHPGQIQPGDQRDVVLRLVRQSHGVQAVVLKQHVAVHRGHERGGVGDDPAWRGLFHGLRLRSSNAQLFMRLGCAAFAFAPVAQDLVHRVHGVPTQANDFGQCLRQPGLAGAFCADDGDAAHAHARACMRVCQARQPHTLMSVKSAYSKHVSHRPL